MKLIRTSLALALIFACASVWAEWKLIPDKSHLSYVSTKKEHIAEPNTFKNIQGSVDDAGNGQIIIDLGSVDTRVPIRDERMQKFFFETMTYPQALYTVSIGAGKLAEVGRMSPGEQKGMRLDGKLDLHGIQHPVSADVLVTKTRSNQVQVATAMPVILRVEDFSLVQGLNKLAELASLPSISKSVPVSFVLTFDVISP